MGEEYGGVVTAATSFGVFVTLDAMYVEGLVHITELGGEYFRFDEARTTCQSFFNPATSIVDNQEENSDRFDEIQSQSRSMPLCTSIAGAQPTVLVTSELSLMYIGWSPGRISARA